MTEKTAEQEMESKPVDNKTPATEATVEEIQDSTTAASDKVTETETAPEPEPLLTDDDFDNDAIVPGSLSRALKQCRNQADLTLEQAAQEIHLPVDIVKALEDENFAALPEAPYVRGYLRSYARLSDSDPGPLIQRFEILRGANPGEITSFNSPVTRNPKPAKKEVSPTTIKLVGFSIIVLLLVVLSMIPTLSQKASDTWKTFSEPQQPVTATSDTEADKTAGNSTDAGDTDTAATENNTQAPNNGTTQNTASTTEATRPAAPTAPMASSRNDTATIPDKSSEQLALNQQDEPSTADGNGENGADTASDADASSNNGSDTTDTPSQAHNGTENTQNDSASASGQTENPAIAQLADTTNSGSAATASGEENTTGQAAQDTQGASAVAAEGDSNTADTDNETTDTDANQLTQAEQTDQSGQAQDTDAESERKKAEQAAAARQAAEDKRKAEQARQQSDRFRQPFDGNVLIRLVFSQPVWMSITDGKGKTIFGSLNTAGTVKELKARTPLQFHVGNAPGVKIYLNGQLVDQRPHTRGSVARFRAN